MSRWTPVTCFILSQILISSIAVDLQFVNQPTSVVTKLGSTIYWNCKAVSDNIDTLDYRWTQNGRDIVSNGPRHTLHSNGTLSIRDLQKIDLSRYECIVSDNLTVIQSGPIYIRLAYIATFFPTYPASQTKYLGDTVSMQCEVSSLPPPLITWQRHDHAVDKGTVTMVSAVRSQLSLPNAEYSDSGSYRCKAKNPVSGEIRYSINTTLVLLGRPIFVQPPQPLSVAAGSDAIFHCQARGNPQPIVLWYDHKNQKQFIVQLNDKFVIQSNGSLKIINVQPEDSGFFTCQVNNAHGQITKMVLLTVTGAIGAPVFSETPQNATVFIGEEVTWRCVATGNPKPAVSWDKDSGALPSGRVTFPYPGAMSLSSIQVTDTGLYTCTAQNSGGVRQHAVYLNVQYGPSFTFTPPTVSVGNQFDPLHLSCQARANPPPVYSWTLPSGVVLTAPKTQGNFSAFENGSLVLYTPREQDSGIYTCRAKNLVSVARASTQVLVTFPPRIVNHNNRTEVVEGEAAILNFSAVGYPPPTFKWTNQNQNFTVQTGEDFHIFSNGSLHIKSGAAWQEGEYKFSAVNTAGESSVTVLLLIIVSPSFDSTDVAHIVRPGSDITLTCDPGGSPWSSLSWNKDGQALKLGSNFSLERNNSLTIKNILPNQYGSYVCIAENKAGNASKVFRIMQTDQPWFVTSPSNQTVKEGARLVVPCSGAANKDQPTAQWFGSDSSGSSGNEIQQESENSSSVHIRQDGHIVFQSIKLTQRGWYKCIAKNTAGIISKLIFIEILALPSIDASNQTLVARPGDQVTLTCRVGDVSTEGVDWTAPRSSQSTVSTHISHMSTGVSHSLVIENVTVEDHFGNWTCSTCNGVGCVSDEIFLSVLGPPVILEADGEITKQERHLTCKVVGTDPVTTKYYWGELYINPAMPPGGHRVEISGPTLVISKSTQSSSTYSCRAENRYGSDELKMKVPGSARNLSAIATEGRSVTLDWVGGHGGGLKTVYITIEYREVTATDWFTITDVSQPPVAVGNLEPYTEYQFRVWSENALGAGAKTGAATVKTLATAPGAPYDVKAKMVGNNTVDVTWKAPRKLNGNRADIVYEVQWRDHSLGEPPVSVSNIPLDKPHVQLHNVRHRSVIRVTLRSVNTAVEEKGPSVTLAFTAVSAAPRFPPNITEATSRAPTSIRVTWEVSSETDITGYILSWRTSSAENPRAGRVVINTTDTAQYVVNNLSAHTTYAVQIAAYNEVGVGPFGKPVSVTTVKDFGSGQNSSGDREGLSSSTIGIIAGILAAVLLVILLILVALRLRRRTKRKALKRHQPRALSQIYNNPALVDTGGSRKSGIAGMYEVTRRSKKMHNSKVNHADVYTISNKDYNKSPWAADMWSSQENLALQQRGTTKNVSSEQEYELQKQQYLYGPKASHVVEGKEDNPRTIYDDEEVAPGVPPPPERAASIPNLTAYPPHPGLAHLYDEIDQYQYGASENYKNVRFMSLPRTNVPRTNPYMSHSTHSLPRTRSRPSSMDYDSQASRGKTRESDLPEFFPNVDRPGLLAIHFSDDDLLKNYRV